MPTIEDLLAYGLGAFAIDARRAREAAATQEAAGRAALAGAAPDAGELAQLPLISSGARAEQAGPMLSFGAEAVPFTAASARDQELQRAYRLNAIDNAAQQMSLPEQVQFVDALERARIKPDDLKTAAETEGVRAKTNNFLQFAQALAEAKAARRPLNVWEVMQGNVATGHALTPVDVQGDTVVNRYDTAAPVLGTTPLGQARIGAEQALGTYRTAAAGDETEQTRLHAAQARQQEMLADARAKLLANPDAPELLKLDALGGNHQLFKGALVKVRQKDGTEVYMRETPNVSGGFDYTPAVGPDNEPLLVPALGGGERKTALERNAQLLSDTYNLPFEDALTLARQGKGQTDAQIAQARWKAAWTEAGKDPRAMFKPDQQRALAVERYREAWGTEPPMDLIQGGSGTPNRSGQGQPARGSGAPAPAQAAGGQPAAGQTVNPQADAIRSAYRAGKLSRDEAMAQLRALGFQ